MKAIPAEHHRHLIHCIILLVGTMWGSSAPAAPTSVDTNEESLTKTVQFVIEEPRSKRRDAIVLTPKGHVQYNSHLPAISADRKLLATLTYLSYHEDDAVLEIRNLDNEVLKAFEIVDRNKARGASEGALLDRVQSNVDKVNAYLNAHSFMSMKHLYRVTNQVYHNNGAKRQEEIHQGDGWVAEYTQTRSHLKTENYLITSDASVLSIIDLMNRDRRIDIGITWEKFNDDKCEIKNYPWEAWVDVELEIFAISISRESGTHYGCDLPSTWMVRTFPN